MYGDDGEDLFAVFSQTIDYANRLGFQTIVDINPALFKELKISYDDLSFFKKLNIWGLRLDEGFTGAEEARMTRNPYGLKIELNMSRGTNYLASIMAYEPDRDNLLGCHNFYPQAFTGLSDQIFAGTLSNIVIMGCTQRRLSLRQPARSVHGRSMMVCQQWKAIAIEASPAKPAT